MSTVNRMEENMMSLKSEQCSLPKGLVRRRVTRSAIAAVLAAMLTASAASLGAGSAIAQTSEPVAGGTLTLGVGRPLLDFDPYQGANGNYIIAKTLYSNLITYNSDLEPIPDLATEWEIADDNLSVTITLRDTVFADGSPLTAKDVVAGIERAQDPAIAITQRGVAEFIESAEEIDPHTVKVNFTRPTGQDRVLDWMVFFPVVKAENNNPDFLKTAAAGSGPFMVKSYSPGNELVLAKNPNYYEDDRPYLDEVVYRFFFDPDALVAALLSGDVDGTVWQELRYDRQIENDYELIDGSLSAQTQLLYVNPVRPPFDNLECRKAVLRAVDRDAVRRAVQGEVGVIVPGPFPPSSPAYDESLFEQVGFDPEAAKAGIAEHCATKTASAAVTPSPGTATILTIVQANLAQVGFDLKLENMDTVTFQTLVRRGELEVASFPTVNPFRSVASLATNRGFSGGDTNYWWFGKGAPADYDAALEAVRSAITPEEIAAANGHFNEALLNNIWTTGLYTMIDRAAMSSKVHNFEFALGSQLVLKNTYVSE